MYTQQDPIGLAGGLQLSDPNAWVDVIGLNKGDFCTRLRGWGIELGRYVSIRGWIECEEKDIATIKEICNHFIKDAEYELDLERRKLYQSGWNFPKATINWTAYVFYGADIREYHSNFIKKQLDEIAKLNSGITGYFLIDDHDADKKLCWQIFGGKLVETEQGEILFNQ
ncbi:hypothetical protein C8Z91_25040 [Paenibacillus elgii]|uniref:Uncharacterized protein n=1 Tax=Paenibacillus elgii TaxID=189691 RepID=A0A2T6FXL7_9BACL|nr:hypothetical protein [Paenibacillus elgii]PUA36647.1 hypothetical protein C8Z91_25040 [Paenibacillus elgii]